MFNLQNVEALCTHYSTRSEKHGDEPVNAGDISISVDVPSAQMEQFDSGLRDAMFRKPLGNGEQDQLIGDGFTALRFPRIKSQVWGDEYTGCELTIGAGLNLSEPLTLVDVRIKGFTLTPKEGGTVTVTFKAQVHPEDEVETGRLCWLAGKPITLSLSPPIKCAEDTQPDLLDDAPNDHLEQAAAAMGKAA